MAGLKSYQNREWLVQFRKLKDYTQHGLAEELGISHVTYLNVEMGARPNSTGATIKTLKKISEKFGIKIDTMYHKTDEQGRLTETASIMDIFTLYTISGFKAIIHSEDTVRLIFAPNVAEYIIDNILNERQAI